MLRPVDRTPLRSPNSSRILPKMDMWEPTSPFRTRRPVPARRSTTHRGAVGAVNTVWYEGTRLVGSTGSARLHREPRRTRARWNAGGCRVVYWCRRCGALGGLCDDRAGRRGVANRRRASPRSPSISARTSAATLRCAAGIAPSATFSSLHAPAWSASRRSRSNCPEEERGVTTSSVLL